MTLREAITEERIPAFMEMINQVLDTEGGFIIATDMTGEGGYNMATIGIDEQCLRHTLKHAVRDEVVNGNLPENCAVAGHTRVDQDCDL